MTDYYDEDENFGMRLARLRKKKGLSQCVLAETVGVSRRVIAYYECEAHRPPTQLLPQLARALDLSVDDLLGVWKHPDAVNDMMEQWGKMKPEDKKKFLDFIEGDD